MFLSEKTSTNRLIGDHPAAFQHRAYSHFFTSEREAQNLCDNICAALKLKSWSVWFTRRLNHRRFGRALYRERRIELSVRGETVGTLLHEMSHDNPTWGHGIHFKLRHLELIRWYDANYPVDPPARVPAAARAPEPTATVESEGGDADLREIFSDVAAHVAEKTGFNVLLNPVACTVRVPDHLDLFARGKILAHVRVSLESWGLTVAPIAGGFRVEMS